MKKLKRYLFIFTIIVVSITTNIVLIVKIRLNETSCDNVCEETTIIKETLLEPEDIKCTIDIKGAIKKPGVYTSECNKNVNDIINLAGGLNTNADTSTINLAKQVKDEMVIIVYTKEEITKKINSQIENECQCPDVKNEVCVIPDETVINNKLININTATIDELKQIPGIGDAKAKAIIEYRNSIGTFKNVSDIKNVSGIGENLYEQIKVYLTT